MGWLASVALLSGGWAVGAKHRFGFVLQLIGNSLWSIIGLRACMFDLAAVEFCFCCLNVWSFYNWRMKHESKVCQE